MDAENEEFAHRANRTTTARPGKTARRRRIPSYYEFATHRLRLLDEAGIPSSPVNALGELSAHPHTRESGMVFEYDRPDGGLLKGVAPAVRVDNERPGARTPPPKLGEQSVDALRVAGYSAQESSA